MQVNVHQAKSQLSKLIERALAGEEVIIARNNKPTVRLEVLPEARRKRKLGALQGLVKFMADDFDEPLDDLKDHTRCLFFIATRSNACSSSKLSPKS